MKNLLCGVVLGLMVVAAAACSGTSPTPTSPSGTLGTTSVGGSSGTSNAERVVTPVGVSGLIRDLDTASRSFNLLLTSSSTSYVRGESRLVRADDATQLTVKGSPARFGALANGMVISVRGTDQGRFILAQAIAAR